MQVGIVAGVEDCNVSATIRGLLKVAEQTSSARTQLCNVQNALQQAHIQLQQAHAHLCDIDGMVCTLLEKLTLRSHDISKLHTLISP